MLLKTCCRKVVITFTKVGNEMHKKNTPIGVFFGILTGDM